MPITLNIYKQKLLRVNPGASHDDSNWSDLVGFGRIGRISRIGPIISQIRPIGLIIGRIGPIRPISPISPIIEKGGVVPIGRTKLIQPIFNR